MLPRSNRIPRSEFAEIMRSRQFSNTPHFTLRTAQGGGRARYAVSVSKKVSKSAVVRNRIRRRVYSALPEADEGLHLIVAKSGAQSVGGEELRRELALLFKKR